MLCEIYDIGKRHRVKALEGKTSRNLTRTIVSENDKISVRAFPVRRKLDVHAAVGCKIIAHANRISRTLIPDEEPTPRRRRRIDVLHRRRFAAFGIYVDRHFRARSDYDGKSRIGFFKADLKAVSVFCRTHFGAVFSDGRKRSFKPRFAQFFSYVGRIGDDAFGKKHIHSSVHKRQKNY